MNYQKQKEEQMDMDQQEIEQGIKGLLAKAKTIREANEAEIARRKRLEMDERGQLSQDAIEERLEGSRLVHPDHYKGYAFDVIDIANEYKLDFLEGNVLKYLLRWRRKNGLEDLKKAQTYLNLLIEKQDGKIMLCRKL